MGRSPRPSAAVILTRGSPRDFEVYLVLRARSMRFLGGMFALPGGVVAEEDGAGASDECLRACALRELFEETGVLLPPLSIPDREGLRKRLSEGDPEARSAFARFAGAGGGAPAAAEAGRSLESVLSLTTPPFGPVRYESVYFHRALPEGENPRIVPGEVEDGRFRRPAEWLDSWRKGEILIVPPVVFVLERLAGRELKDGLAAASAGARALEEGKLHPVRFTPGLSVFPLATPTLPPASTTNAFFVGEEGFYVVDPAPVDRRETERLLEAISERGDRPQGILLSHHHPDHVGAAGAVARAFGLKIRAHRLTLERTRFPDSMTGAPVEDGERIGLGRAPDGRPGWTLRALFTPGHDRGHLAFIESRYRSVLAGDLVSTVSTIVIDPPEGHLATYLASLRRLLAEDPGMVYPSHGLPRRDGMDLLREYLDHRALREEALVAALASGLETVGELTPRVYPDVPRMVHRLASRSLIAGLEKLVEEGRAERTGDRYRPA